MAPVTSFVTAATPIADRMLIRLAYHARTPDEDVWIRDHIARIEDPVAFWELAHDNRVAPRVHQELDRLDLLEMLPPDIRAKFEQQSAHVVSANRRRLEVASGVLAALLERGIDVVVLKGVAFGASLYDNPGYKRMNDVDVLLRREQVRDAMQVLGDQGLLPIAERVGGDPEKQLEVTHHLPPYVNRDLSCMIGVQWDFRSPLLGHEFDLDAVWDRTVPLDLDGVEVRMLGPEDALHHVALHLERFRTGVRDVMDLHNLVFAHGERFDWDLFARLVREAGTEDDVFYALSFAQAHRPHERMRALLEELEPRAHPRIRRLAAHRCRSERVLVRICSRQFSTIEKLVTAFNATNLLREKAPLFVQGWASIFWPSLQDALKISAIVEPTFAARVKARLVAPWRLMQAIAEEIGGLLLLGLAVKSWIDLGRAAVPFGDKQGLEHYARRLGLDTTALRTAQEHIQ